MSKGRSWKIDQVILLKALLQNGVDLPGMAAHIGRSQASVRQKIISLARDNVKEAVAARLNWSISDLAELFRLREAGLTFSEIGREIGRPAIACKSMFNNSMSARRAAATASSEPQPKDAQQRAFAERDACLAIDHCSITAAIMGDPLPGRSALDLRERLS